jgi:hypothetical protein
MLSSPVLSKALNFMWKLGTNAFEQLLGLASACRNSQAQSTSPACSLAPNSAAVRFRLPVSSIHRCSVQGLSVRTPGLHLRSGAALRLAVPCRRSRPWRAPRTAAGSSSAGRRPTRGYPPARGLLRAPG